MKKSFLCAIDNISVTRRLGNVRLHMMFRPGPSTFCFISLPNEKEKEKVQKLSNLSANNKSWIRELMRLAINESTGRKLLKQNTSKH